MKLPDAPWQHRPGIARLLGALGAAKGDTRFVGGCVRDTLLGLDASDVDLATKIAPDDVMRRLEAARIKAVPTGLAHGTVTAVIGGAPVEVTTLRRDVATDGRRATVAYTEDWREDAARRDFTINALSADPAGGEVFDYHGGLADLEAGRVRFIGDPLQRIAEDHLRILRFFRFHARFGRGAPDAAALDACAARANDLMALSRERIADELLKLLALPDPTATVALMIARGILRPVLPEIESADRLAALVAAERAAGIDPNPIRRLASLLPVDPDVTADVAARLRLSKRAAKRLVSAAQPMAPRRRPGPSGSEGETGPRPSGSPQSSTLRGAPSPGNMTAEALAYRIGTAEAVDNILLHGKAGPELKALESWQRPRLPVGGGDLIAMGLEPGPAVAATLQAIEEEWLRAGFPADRAAVRAIARAHVDQALRSSQ